MKKPSKNAKKFLDKVAKTISKELNAEVKSAKKKLAKAEKSISKKLAKEEKSAKKKIAKAEKVIKKKILNAEVNAKKTLSNVAKKVKNPVVDLTKALPKKVAKKKVAIDMSSTIVMSGRMILSKENPLALRAVSSLCSAKLPKVMSEESNMAKGSAIGIIPAETYTSSSRITQTLSPLPIRSSI